VHVQLAYDASNARVTIHSLKKKKKKKKKRRKKKKME